MTKENNQEVELKHFGIVFSYGKTKKVIPLEANLTHVLSTDGKGFYAIPLEELV